MTAVPFRGRRRLWAFLDLDWTSRGIYRLSSKPVLAGHFYDKRGLLDTFEMRRLRFTVANSTSTVLWAPWRWYLVVIRAPMKQPRRRAYAWRPKPPPGASGRDWPLRRDKPALPAHHEEVHPHQSRRLIASRLFSQLHLDPWGLPCSLQPFKLDRSMCTFVPLALLVSTGDQAFVQ